jgi:hypothetical protein
MLAVQRRRALGGREAAPGDTTVPDSAGVAQAAEPSVGRYLLGVLAGACVVSALTTPALANTHAGQSAVPHGTLHGVHSDH